MTASVAPGSAWRSLLAPGLATLAALAILVSLGIWQLERKAWKEGLIAQIEARAYGAPGALTREAEWPAWSAANDEFRRVRLTGTFRHDLEIQLHGLAHMREAAVQGYYVFTPLTLETGATVIVNRGFVPTELRDPKTRAEGQVSGPVTGLVRASEAPGWFLPANDPGRNEWFVRNIAEMARAQGLDRAAPFYIDADASPNPGGWPRGGQTRLTLKNDHLGYALTWFGLAAALLGVFAVFAWRKLHGEPAGSGGEFQPDNARDDQADAGQAQGIRGFAE
jgi:surfeit locus 1 family protein